MFTGVDAIVIYASNIFANVFNIKKSGIVGSMVLGAVNSVCTFIAAPFAEHKPRKMMLMIGVIGVACAHTVTAFLYLFN